MAIGSGLSAQLGVKAESVYGTPVVVDRFYEFNNESMKVDEAKVYSMGLGRGRFQRGDRVKSYIKSAAGSVELDVLNKSFGLLFQHALGQDTITGAAANKTHTIIPDALAQQGKSLTLQVGRPDSGGTVRAFTYEGVKIIGFELKCGIDEVLKVTFDLDAQTVLTATGLATASWVATQEAFVFSEGVLTLGGVTIATIKSFSLKYAAALNTERRGLGNTKLEPVANGEATIEMTVDAEFDDLVQYAAFVAGTQVAALLTFTTTTVIPTTAVAYSLTVNIPAMEYTAADANVSGPDVLAENLVLKGLDDGVNAPITLAYVTSDAAA